jgi:hypothetical protein
MHFGRESAVVPGPAHVALDGFRRTIPGETPIWSERKRVSAAILRAMTLIDGGSAGAAAGGDLGAGHERRPSSGDGRCRGLAGGPRGCRGR